VIRRALAVTLVSLACGGSAAAAEPSDDIVELNFDPSEGVAFALKPSAGDQTPVATVLEWNGDDVCVVVPPGSPRRVIAESHEGRWSIEDPDGHRRVVAVRVDEHTGPRGLSSLTPEQISQLWGVFVDAWSPKVARLMAHVDPTRACITIDSELRPLPPLDRRLRYLAVAPYTRGRPKVSLSFIRYRELRYLRLTGFPLDFERERVDAATVRAMRLEYLRLFGDVAHIAALGRLTALRKLDLRGVDQLGDPAFLSDLRKLEELALSGVEDLRPAGGLPTLQKIEADAAPVRELPLVAMPALRYLDILSSPVPTDVVRRFAALNPRCRIRHRFNEILQDMFRDASLVRISWLLRGKRVPSTAEERRPAEIQALASKLRVAETTERTLCGCMPSAWLEITTPRGKSRLDFNCGSALQTAELPADANLTPSSVTALERWLEQHGVDLANCDGCTAHGPSKQGP
jgi:hypothetical protein